jgi:P27 family predicted phage terminase small subunit
MATRGRKPTPTSIKLLKGTRRDRLPTAEPRPRSARPKCPGHLDAVAKAEWKRRVEEFDESRVLTKNDSALLALYCQAFSRYRKAQDDIEEYGLLIETDQGSWKANPAVQIQATAEAFMSRVLIEFGGSPSARTRVKAAEADGPRDALSEFLQRRKGGA